MPTPPRRLSTKTARRAARRTQIMIWLGAYRAAKNAEKITSGRFGDVDGIQPASFVLVTQQEGAAPKLNGQSTYRYPFPGAIPYPHGDQDIGRHRQGRH